MTPGEMYWVEFPPSNGHEQAGRRPAIVLQDDAFANKLSVAIIVPVTGSLANSRFPATVRISPTDQNGLLVESVILVYQIRAMDRKRFGNRIGVIERPVLEQIFAMLDKLTGRGPTPGNP